MSYHDEDEDVEEQGEDREAPDPSDQFDSDETEHIDCPYCGKPISEFAFSKPTLSNFRSPMDNFRLLRSPSACEMSPIRIGAWRKWFE